MSDAATIARGLMALSEVARLTAARAGELEPIVAVMRECLRTGGTLFFAGNGGSAADAQHLATEYVVRYQAGSPQRPMRAIALTTDTSVMTAAANDFGFDQIFLRQLQALARPGDVLVLHSTSGNSPNCVVAAIGARKLGVATIALLGGDGGALQMVVDQAFIVPDAPTNLVQEIHLAIQHQVTAILTGESHA